MVKGNWERRCEMANIKRAEAKERKVLKKSGKVVNPESILQKLYKDTTLKENGARIDVYVADPEGGKLCSAHLRTAECRIKKCRLIHVDTISVAQLRNLPPIGGMKSEREDDEGCRPPPAPDAAVFDSTTSSSVPEKRCLPSCPIDEIMPLKDWSTLMFAAVDSECVYDYLTPAVWNSWITKHRAVVAAAQTPGSVGLSTVHEGTGGDDDDDSDGENETEEELNASESQVVTSSSHLPITQNNSLLITLCNGKSNQNGLVEQCPPAAAVLLSYLSVADIVGSVSLACKSLKTCALRDEGFRIRRCLFPQYHSYSLFNATRNSSLLSPLLVTFPRNRPQEGGAGPCLPRPQVTPPIAQSL